MIRTCSDCQTPYSVEPEEEDWFRREGLSLPKRCPRCRAARRNVHERFLTCSRCGRTFSYPKELQLYARTYGWGKPRRCISGCEGGGDEPETVEEKGMREFMEQLRDQRSRGDAPPIEMVLETQRSRQRARRDRAQDLLPPVEPLFAGLADRNDGEDQTRRLREKLTGFTESRTGPGDLFGGLAREGDEPRKKSRRKKRRPKPRD